MSTSDVIRVGRGRGRFGLLLLAAALLLLGSAPAHADDCSDFPNGIVDGFAGTPVPPSQITIDRNCTVRNYPNGMSTNFSFNNPGGQDGQEWLIIFDNVAHTGQMSCNAVHDNKIWFVNGSFSGIHESCQNLFIPVEKIDKKNPVGQTTAAIGVPFTYSLTIPVLFDAVTGTVIDFTGSENQLHGVTVTDDLNATGADLTYVSHTITWRDTGVPVPHSFTNNGGLLTFEFGSLIIPAGDQFVINLTVVLDDSPANVIGTQFVNTARWDFGRLIDGVFYEPLPGENGISPPLTIAAPQLVMTKSGPATLGLTLNLGEWGQFALDVENTGQFDAWNVTIRDVLPNGATGGMCDVAPEIQSVTLAGNPLTQGTHYTLNFTGAPTCEVTLVLLDAAGAIGPDEHLIINYRTRLDADSQDGATLTNVAGATEWFNGDSTVPDRVTFTRPLTDGTPAEIDHEDAHTVTVALHGYFFEKTVQDLTSGANPASTAAPGDTLRYTLRLQATDVPLTDVRFFDDLGAMNAPTAAFVPGSLTLVAGTIPPGADVSNTNPNGGTNGSGLLDIRNLSIAANSSVTISFDIQLAGSLTDGTIVLNQSDLFIGNVDVADSDDPNVNGQADPDVVGDEDPTRVLIEAVPAPALQKANTQSTAAVGVPFAYRVTVPPTPHTAPLYDVRILDDLTASAADLQFVSVAKISGPGTWTPTNTGTATQLVIEDPVNGIDIPAGQQVVIEITVVLTDSVTNVAGLQFTNTASYTYNLVDENDASQRPGGPGTTAPMTIIEPDLTLEKSGPARMILGIPETFTLDIHNTTTTPAWNLTINDLLPNDADGGTCDAAPTAVTARVFQSDGTTPVSGPLAAGSDFSVSWSGTPSCALTLTMLSAASVVGPDQRLIVTYQTVLDAGSQEGATLTNIAGAVEWFSADASSSVRRTYTRTITDGTPALLDFQDAHTVIVGLPNYLFEKTVINVTTGQNPGTQASPGDRLRYQLRIENLGAATLDDLSIVDDLDSRNTPAAFQAGTLQLVTVPPGADASNTSATGGSKGTGLLDVRNISVAPGASVVVEFEIVLAAVIANGTDVTNQSLLSISGSPLAPSDDPNVDGPADPFVPNDEDPTVVQIGSAPVFRVQKISTDLTGDPNVLLPGDTLRYTITVKNIGNANVTDAALRDAVPANTTYVPNSTTLNGTPVPDGPLGSPLASGIPIHAPEDPTPGAMRADASATTANVATIVFDVTINVGVVDGTIISNQGFVTAPNSGAVETPSDDPDTVIPNDPTRDVVGSVPLLFAPKSAALLIDNGSPGIVDPLDTLHYTITIYNQGAVPATGIVLTDNVPANTSYVAGSTTLNGSAVPDAPAGFPLAAGLAIPDLAPGQSAVIGFNLQVNAGVPTGTLIVNQATITTNETPNVLTDGDGNPATGPEPTVVVVGDQQQLTITKQVAVVGGGPVLAGSTLEYLVTITNVSNVPAQTVVITDDVDATTPGYLTLVPGSATMNGATTGVTQVGSLITADYSGSYGPLAPGASAVLRFRATIGAAVPNGTTVTNTGVVTWNNATQTASASVSVQVGLIPGVGMLSGAAWHDADFDDVFDGARPLVGWTVDLLRNNVVIATVLTDGAGAYQINAVPPNDLNGDQYVLRFRAPGAGLNTASLGVTSSAFTNGPQQISNILVPTSGANLTDLNLPIDPNGVVYTALGRTPVSGATVTMLAAGSGSPLPGSCFLDPAQQNQVTLASGFYKFDLTFGDVSCPPGGAYLLAVTAPGAGFGVGVSQLIPPTSDGTTPPFSVPGCPGGPSDAVPVPPGFCEAQALPTAPVPPAPTTYYLHFTLDNSSGSGSAELFNNHVPLDPILADLVTITKTTPSLHVSRGQLVPYEITVNNTQSEGIADLVILDRFPRGFHYVEGSARIEGQPVEPVASGFDLRWTVPDGLPANSKKTLLMLLAVGAGVSEGEFTNRAQAVSALGFAYSGEAFATVRVVPDPTFDCTDVIGKVFDDANRNGEQDGGEHGLANVRLVTARGLAATTDPHGRFHITCAVVPREERGSNFVLKLDDRTLPSGYRMTTRQVQVQRATRGKVLPFHFGAAIGRVVEIDVADAVFEPNTTTMREQWKPRVALLIEELAKSPSILRLSYVADVEDAALVEDRVAVVKQMIAEAWAVEHEEPLNVETEIFWRRGGPPSGGSPAGVLESMLPSVDAGPPMVETTPGNSVERQMSADTPFNTWAQDPQRIHEQIGDKLEKRQVTSEQAKIVKLRNVVPPIHFESGVANIPPSTISKLRSVLDSMKDLPNVRLHLVGHADSEPLSPALTSVFGDNQGLSRERAGEVAEFIQTALALPPEAIAFDWAGDTQPLASNATEAGRAQNRRVEVEVWYDQMEAKSSLEDVVVHEEIKRVKVCRTETVCKLSYQEGHARRARVKNLIPPLPAGEESVQVSEEFVRQIGQAMHDLRDKQDVTVKFIGFTDDAPLSGRAERIYGTHLALSKAIAHRTALAVKDALKLPTAAIASDGRGAIRPIASNQTDRGRALNRRVEVELWYDDPLADLPQEPQICPDGVGADLVTVVYDPPWGPIEPLQLDAHGEAQVPDGYGDALRRALGEVADRTNPRLRFIGYTRNERLERRTALVYGDDVGLSTARARRAMDKIKAALTLGDQQAEHEGRGYVQSDDVVNAGFVQGDTSYVVVQVVYDDLALRDDYEGVEVTPLTRELQPKEPLALNLMRITVDGKPIDDPGRSLADIQRCTDVALDDAQIQFRFDNLKVVPRLSVTAAPIAAPVDGEAAIVAFKAYTNYPYWIAKSEVRIFERGQSVQAEPLGVVPVDELGNAQWQPPADAFESPARELEYVLRAYDEQGRFDETEPQSLWLVYAASSPDLDRALPQAKANGDPLLANYGETGPSTRNIAIGNAGSIQVHGSGVPANHSVYLAGAPVPVDANGNFVGEVVLPQGVHTVEVAVLDEQGNGELFLRDLELKKSDWFYVGIADVTVQADLEGQPVRGALQGQDAPYDPNSNADGRLAFFTTGKFWDTWRLTASADTREEPIEDLFKDFVKKNPETLFRRIDPDYYYPTFGDDGTVTELAPTSGKFFAKLEQSENHAMWGNFKVGYLDNELVQVDRGLYGGNVHYQTLATTEYGEQRLSLDAFGAEPGTVPSREEFRGTEGSLYFLRRQDILVGSERLRVEVRDKDSGLVTGVVNLRPTVDYDIDYLQGRILLTEPLSSTVADNLLVRSEGLSGDEAWLVAQYEYTPGFDEIDSLAAGGTGSLWVFDWLKLGATGNRNNNDGSEDSSLYGGDVTARLSTDSWVKAQMGRSEGLVTTSFRSDDGGFLFANIGDATLVEADANAYRADVSLGVSDFIDGARGRLSLYGQQLDEGYAGPGMTALTDTQQFGGRLGIPITKRLQLVAKGDQRQQDDGLTTRAAEVDLGFALTDYWSIGTGVRSDDRDDDSAIVPLTQDEGERTDAVVKLGFDPKGRWRAYTFGQGTVARSGDREANNRGGVGGAYRLNDRFGLEGEVSGGNLGPAVRLGTRYQQTKDTQHYLSYGFDNEREYGAMHERRGTLVSGIKSRLSDSSTVYLEDRYQHGDSSGLSRAMGLSFAPSERWTLSANWGFGTLIDHQTHAETERNAGGGRLSYGFEDLHLSTGVEYRRDETEQPDLSINERTTWLFRNNFRYQVTPSGRVLGKFNHSFSDSSLGDFYNGGYTEAVLGYAYRPVAFDRLHTLVKYTYYYNVPTTDQVTVLNTPVQFLQKSHVAAIDATYDINKFFSIGGKYGYRLSQVSLDRDDPDFFDNNAHLYIVRGDYRFMKNWEGTVEGRMLDLTDLDERKIGSLITVYRHFGENLKVGVGYNFTDFSDDLTDLSYDHQGVFFNIVGSM